MVGGMGQARQLDGQAPLPLYGLAQLSLLQQTGDYTNAISFLENALSQVPGWMDALQVLLLCMLEHL